MTEYVLAKPATLDEALSNEEEKHVQIWDNNGLYEPLKLSSKDLQELFVPLEDKKQQIRELAEELVSEIHDIYDFQNRDEAVNKEEIAYMDFADALVSLIWGEKEEQK